MKKKLLFLNIALFFVQLLLLTILHTWNNASLNNNGAYLNEWRNGNAIADFNNPEWRTGPLRRRAEWGNVFNRPFEYVRYSEMGSWTQASPYAQYYGYERNYFPYGHAVSPYSSLDGRHNTYYRGVMHNGHNYRNVRWAR